MSETREGGFGASQKTADKPKEIPAIKNYYLLAIAVDKYSGGFNLLSNPVRDTKGVIEVLKEKYRFEEDRIKEFFDADAKRGLIKKEIERIYNLMGSDDALLIWFSGHGVQKMGTYYAIPYNHKTEEGEDNWLNVDEIYSGFTDYTTTNKCRDLLIVLDCCYAGNMTMGQHGQKKLGNFSRQVLTSSSATEKASDGVPLEGSPFANAFSYLLNNNDKPQFMLNEPQKMGALTANFETNRQKSKLREQTIVYEPLKVLTYGEGHFVFELNEKYNNVPPIDKMARLFRDDFGFAGQRGIIKNDLDAKPLLCVFSSLGKIVSEQKLLTKYFFEEKKKTIGDPLSNFSPIRLTIENDDVWGSLFNNFKPEQNADKISDKRAYVVDMIFNRLKGVSHENTEGGQNSILRVSIPNAHKDLVQPFADFCKDLNELLIQKKNSAEKEASEKQEKPPQIGRLFLIYWDEYWDDSTTDEENVDGLINREYWLNTAFRKVERTKLEKLNVFLTGLIEPINKTIIEDLFTGNDEQSKLDKIIETPRFKELTIKHFFASEQNMEEELFVSTVIKKIIEHCYVNDKHKETFMNRLYDFNNPL